MREMLEQIRKAICIDLHFVALSSALMIPDIAGASDSKDSIATGEKYRTWYDKWIGSSCSFMNGEICYQMRCSLLHQGSLNLNKVKFKRVLFVHPAIKGLHMHCNILNDALNLDIGRFCLDLIRGCENWLMEIENTLQFKTNYDKFMRVYPTVLPPYIVGVPVIS